MLRGRHHARNRKLQFTPRKVPRVVGNKMFNACRNRQLQHMVVIFVRQVGSPAKIDPLPCRSRAEIIQYRFALSQCDLSPFPQHFPLYQFFIFCKQGRTHKSLILTCKTSIQYSGARPLKTEQRGHKNIGVLHNIQYLNNDITCDISQGTDSNSHYVGQTSGLPAPRYRGAVISCADCAVPLAPQGIENFVRWQIITFPLPCSK